MTQKVIRVGNSLAVTIPKSFANQAGWKVGKHVFVNEDVETEMLTIQALSPRPQISLTPEFLRWLKKFNTKYKTVLMELAKK